MNKYKHTIVLMSAMTLCACAPYGLNEKRAGVCNTLNSAMIFSGSTSNTSAANVERAQEPLVQRTYDKDCYQAPTVNRNQH